MTDWQTKRLGELAKVQTGPFGAQLHEKDYITDGETPIITVENLVGGVVKLLPGTPRVSDEDKKRLHKYILSEGDIVFSRVGSVDRSAYVTSASDGWMFSGRLLRVHPKDLIDAKYLNYHFSDEKTKNLIRNLAVGGTMASLNTEILNFVPITYPEKPEQERIVGVLGVWDEYIEKLEQKIALKEQLKKGLMRQLLTGKRRLPGFSDTWTTIEFYGVFNVISKFPGYKTNEYFSEGQYPIYDQSYDKNISGYTYKTDKLIESNAPYILFGDHSRVVKYVDAKHFAVGNDGIKLFQAHDDIDSYYAYLLLKLCKVPNTGYNRHFKYIAEAAFEVPSFAEQIAISKLLKTADDEIDNLKTKINEIKLQKKSLLKKLITGMIRTPKNLRPKGANS